MPLEKQPYKLPLAQGMNTKSDPKTLTGGLTLVQNGVYRKDGETVKRSGWTSFVRTTANGGSISSADAGATFENELLLWANNHLYTWSPSQAMWFDRGAAYSAAVETRQIISTATVVADFADSVYSNGLVLVAWETGLTTHYQIYDYQTGAILTNNTQIAFGVTIRPKCITFSDGSLWVAYTNAAGGISAQPIDRATGVVGPIVDIVFDLGLVNAWDMISVAGDTVLLCYAKSTTGNFGVKYLNSAMGARGGSYVDSTATTGNASVLRLFQIPSGSVVVAYVNTSATNIQARLINSTGSSIGTARDTGVAKTSGTTSALALAGHALPSANANTVRIYVQFTDSVNEQKNFVQRIDWDTVTSGGGSSVIMRSVGLASRGWVHGTTGFVTVFHKSDLQASFFVIDENGVVVSRHQPGTGGAGSFNGCVSNVWSAVSGKYEFAITNKTRIIATTDTLQLYSFAGSTTPSGAKIYSIQNVGHTSIDFQDNANFSTAELGGTLLIAGGALKMYDGISVVEHGFFLWPEGLSAASTAGSITDGTYLYAAVYEWTDAKGFIHRSAPSIPLSVAVSGGPKGNIITVPTLRITERKTVRADVTIALYRTQAGQSSTFYRVSSITSPTFNSTSSDTAAITDTLADTSLPGRDFLYTAGGVLDNSAAVAAKFIKVWRNRVVLGGTEDGSIQYSKPCAKGSPVEFATENTLELESDGGPMTGFEILDEKLVAFKNDWGYLTYGDGPDALGLNGTFAPLERIASCDVGCIDQQSTCAIPGAVIFKSEKGYQMLGRDLSAQYIGAMVEDYNSLSVTSATLFATRSEIRITNSDGVTLVYNYEFQRWSAFDNHNAVDGLRWQNKFVHVRSDGKVCVETEGTYRDDGTNYDVTFITGWQAFGDVSGFQRIYRAELVGEYKSPHTLSLSTAYDYNDTLVDAGTFNLSSSGNRWQFLLNRQKCTAMRFKIVASVSETSLSGEAIKLSAISFIFGIKRPMSKLPSAQKTGLSTI